MRLTISLSQFPTPTTESNTPLVHTFLAFVLKIGQDVYGRDDDDDACPGIRSGAQL